MSEAAPLWGGVSGRKEVRSRGRVESVEEGRSIENSLRLDKLAELGLGVLSVISFRAAEAVTPIWPITGPASSPSRSTALGSYFILYFQVNLFSGRR